MQQKTCYHSSKFVVQDARKFKKDFEANVEGDKQLIVEKDGFTIIGTDLIYDDPLEECDLDSIAEFIQKNLREDHTATLTITYHGSQLGAEFYYINEFGTTWAHSTKILEELKHNHFPIKVKARESVLHKKNKVWIEKDKEYLVTQGPDSIGYCVHHEDGNEVYWGKGHFYGTETNA